jgi:hypothetical protein
MARAPALPFFEIISKPHTSVYKINMIHDGKVIATETFESVRAAIDWAKNFKKSHSPAIRLERGGWRKQFGIDQLSQKQ